MAIILNEEDLEWIKQFKNTITESMKYHNFYNTIAKEIFSERYLLPEEICDVAKTIKRSRFVKSYNEEMKYVSNEISVKPENLSLSEQKNLMKIYIALKEQKEDYQEKTGNIFNSAINMLQQAMAWMSKTFQNINDKNCEKIIIIKQENDDYRKFPFTNTDYPDEEYR